MNDDLKTLLKESYDTDRCKTFLSLVGEYNQSFSSFNTHYQRLFKVQILYEAYRSGLFQKFLTAIYPDVKFDLPGGLSFQDFIICMNKSTCTLDNKYVSKKGDTSKRKGTFFDILTEEFLFDYCNNDDSISVSAHTLSGAEAKNVRYTLYIPVDYKSIHKFSAAFLAICSNYGINYEFGIDKHDGFNSCANMWIEASEEDFDLIIMAIEDAKNACENIKFNQKMILGYPYNDHIVVAPETKTNKECFINEMAGAINYYAEDRPNFNMFMATTSLVIENGLMPAKNKCEETHKLLEDLPVNRA